MSEPEYLTMGERAWIVECGDIDIGIFSHPAGSIIRATSPAKVTPIYLATKLYPIEDEL
jgi:hypothetical protein